MYGSGLPAQTTRSERSLGQRAKGPCFCSLKVPLNDDALNILKQHFGKERVQSNRILWHRDLLASQQTDPLSSMVMKHFNASLLLQRPREQAYAAYQLAPNAPHCGKSEHALI